MIKDEVLAVTPQHVIRRLAHFENKSGWGVTTRYQCWYRTGPLDNGDRRGDKHNDSKADNLPLMLRGGLAICAHRKINDTAFTSSLKSSRYIELKARRAGHQRRSYDASFSDLLIEYIILGWTNSPVIRRVERSFQIVALIIADSFESFPENLLTQILKHPRTSLQIIDNHWQ